MFQLPSLVTVSIVAQRMHRSLTDFASNTTDVYATLPFSLVPTIDDNLRTVRAKSQSYSGFKPHSTEFK